MDERDMNTDECRHLLRNRGINAIIYRPMISMKVIKYVSKLTKKTVKSIEAYTKQMY